LELAKEHGLPALVHTPHRDKVTGTKRSLALVREVGIDEELVVIDHLNELTLPLVLETGCWRGHSIYPNTKMSEERMVALLKQYGTEKMIVNSAADWGRSDPLKVPKTGRPCWPPASPRTTWTWCCSATPLISTPRAGASRWTTPAPRIDQTQLWEDNSVLRGQTPVVEP
jgi:hypothetical protein